MRPWLLCTVLALSVAAAVPAHAKPSPGEFGALPLLLLIPKARAELGLSPRQAAALEKLRAMYDQSMRHLGAGGDASCAERAEAARQHINSETLALLTPRQRRLLPGIERRALGATLLYSPATRRELNLAPWQEKKIEAIRAQAVTVEERVNRAAQLGRISRERRVERLRRDRLQRARKIWSVLTPAQRQAFWAGAAAA